MLFTDGYGHHTTVKHPHRLRRDRRLSDRRIVHLCYHVFSQRAASRRDSVTKELAHREVLYADLMKEATNLLVDSIDRTLDKPANLIALYSLASRIRLVSSEEVVLEADKVIETVIESYSSAPTTFQEIHDQHVKNNSNPLHAFAQACRDERVEMLRQM